MKLRAYYNDSDPKVCAWVRELIRAGEIMEGDVDDRPIEEVQASEITGYIRRHWFCGIAGWDRALRLANWPIDRSVDTGSTPCQPFSVAGSRKGNADKRHLWPDWFRLVREHRPDTIFGEQVAGAISHGWLDGISADLEGEGYAVGAVVLGAHSVGAPHIRQRLYWVAARGGVALADGGDARAERQQRGGEQRQQPQDGGAGDGVALAQSQLNGSWGAGTRRGAESPDSLANSGLANRERPRLEGSERQRTREECEAAQRSGGPRGLDNLASPRPNSSLSGPKSEARDGARLCGPESGREPCGVDDPPPVRREDRPRLQRGDDGQAPGDGREPHYPFGPEHLGWCDFSLHKCLDGKTRRIPTECGFFPLVARLPFRVGSSSDTSASENEATGEGRIMRLRGYGNSIVPQAAASFVKAFLEYEDLYKVPTAKAD